MSTSEAAELTMMCQFQDMATANMDAFFEIVSTNAQEKLWAVLADAEEYYEPRYEHFERVADAIDQFSYAGLHAFTAVLQRARHGHGLLIRGLGRCQDPANAPQRLALLRHLLWHEHAGKRSAAAETLGDLKETTYLRERASVETNPVVLAIINAYIKE